MRLTGKRTPRLHRLIACGWRGEEAVFPRFQSLAVTSDPSTTKCVLALQQPPNQPYITKNTTGSSVTYSGTIVQPTKLLNMDPQRDVDITRWTAPSAGTWKISGEFQGIDIFEKSHTVEIVENSNALLLAPTIISAYGQTVNFSDTVSLAKGATIDFMVNYTTNYNNLSTGFSAIIQPASVPEPSSFALSVIASLGCGTLCLWKRRVRV